MDVNGLLSVSAREEKSGKEQSIKIEGASVLAREEVSKMIQEAEENAAFDKSKRSLVNITYELDNLLSKISKFEDTNTFSYDSELQKYFSQSYQKLQTLYSQKNYQAMLSSLDYFNHAVNLLTMEFMKDRFLSKKQKGNVIDITGQ